MPLIWQARSSIGRAKPTAPGAVGLEIGRPGRLRPRAVDDQVQPVVLDLDGGDARAVGLETRRAGADVNADAPLEEGAQSGSIMRNGPQYSVSLRSF